MTIGSRTFIRIIALLLALGIPAIAQAEEAAPAPKEVEHRIGGVLGVTTGVGLSYGQLYRTSGWGWALSGFPYWSENERFLTFGARVTKLLHEKNQWRLYTALGAMFVSAKQEEETLDLGAEESEEHTIVTAGPSIGVEMKIEAISLSIEVPAAAIIPIAGDVDFSLVPYPGVQVFYRW